MLARVDAGILFSSLFKRIFYLADSAKHPVPPIIVCRTAPAKKLARPDE